MGILLIGEIDHLQQLMDNAVTLLFAIFQEGWDDTDVLRYGHIGKQTNLLNHIADMAA